MSEDRPRDVASAGAAISRARAAMVLLHGRGATAEGILSLADAFANADIAYLAPEAPDHTWYPFSFLAPYAQNEPALSMALGIVGDLLGQVVRDGMPMERIVLLGFSQGGCLALEYAARTARRYGAVVGLSAGLIGPEGAPRSYLGSLDRTPVFIGCSNVDGHIPLWRVRETTTVMTELGGDVTERIYPGMGHTVNDDEIEQVKRLLAEL